MLAECDGVIEGVPRNVVSVDECLSEMLDKGMPIEAAEENMKRLSSSHALALVAEEYVQKVLMGEAKIERLLLAGAHYMWRHEEINLAITEHTSYNRLATATCAKDKSTMSIKLDHAAGVYNVALNGVPSGSMGLKEVVSLLSDINESIPPTGSRAFLLQLMAFVDSSEVDADSGAVTKRSIECTLKGKAGKDVKRKPAGKKKIVKHERSVVQKIAAVGLRGLGAFGGYMTGAGAAKGWKAGAAFSKFIGAVEYKIKKNSMLVGSPTFGPAKVNIKHREYVGEVISSTGWSATTFYINPGNGALFPWLSSIAIAYQQYSIRGMVFSYVSTCGSAIASTNNTLGTVMMFTQYDSSSPIYGSKVEAENSDYASAEKASKSFMHAIECARNETPLRELYVTSAESPASVSLVQSQSTVGSGSNLYVNVDPKTYFWGAFTVATTGMQAGSLDIGEIHVAYDIELLKPSAPSLDNEGAHLYGLQGASTAAYYGAAGTRYIEYSTWGVAVTNTKFTVAYLPAGSYIFSYAAFGASTASLAEPSFTLGGSATSAFLTLYDNDTQSSVGTAGAPTTTYVSLTAFISVTLGGSVSLTASGGTLPGTPTWVDIFLLPVSSQILA
jgi:hypothetical protein